MDPSQRERYAVRVRLSLASMPIGYTQERIKDRLCFYFQSKQGGNCDVDYIRLMGEDAKCSWYRVAFDEQSGAKNVLARPDHAMIVDGIKIPLEVQGFQALPGTSMSLSSEAPTRSGPRVSRAVAESPSLTAADIQIESEIYGENLQDDPEEEDEKLIEVTGLKITKDDEVLKLCFEIPHIYGGGEIETLERDFKTPGPIRITFTNPSTVTSVVAEKEQMLSQTTLKVKLITKKRDQSLSLKTQCVFLKGIPDGCTTDYLKLLMEYTTSMEEEPMIQYGEKPGTAICTFSTDIPDLEAVTRRISERKVRGVSVTAEKCNQSDAILVQDFSRDSSLEMLELYFDNKKKSGGSEVRDVQPGPVDGQAIVFFEDWRAVQNVLAKGYHKLGGSELLVESYHDFLGRLSPFDAPTPHIPKPVTVEVRESIMEFLYGKGEDAKKKLLLKELAKVKANLQWPDGSQKSQAKIEPVIDESQHQSSWLNWEKEAQGVLTDFMKGYKTTTVPVPQTLWKDAADTLKLISTTCSMVPDTQLYEVMLIGKQEVVDATEATINDIIVKLQKEAVHDAEQVKQNITWDAEKLQLFTLCGIKQQIEKSFPALKITVFSSPGETGITLDGKRKTVKEAELNIRRRMDSLEKTEFKAGSIKVRFVQLVPDKIHEVLGSQNIQAACSGSDDGKVTIYGATSRDVREAKAYIDNEIDEDVITIKGTPLAVVQGQEGKKLLDCINKQKLVMVDVKQDRIELSGFKSKLEEAKSDIIRFFKNTTLYKEYIPCNASDIKTINRLWHEELEFAEMENQGNHVKIELQTQGGNTGFDIAGNQEGIEAARKFCRSLMERITRRQQYPPGGDKPRTLSLDTELHSAQDLQETTSDSDDEVPTVATQQQDDSNSQQATVLQRVHRRKRPVLVKSDRTSTLFQNVSKDETDSGLAPSKASQFVGKKKIQRIMRPKTFLSDVRFVTNGLTIVVRNGNITNQQVHAIVSPSNQKLQHGGGASKAIEMAAGPQLGSFFADVLANRPNQPLQMSECIVSPGFNLSCRNIIHAVGPAGQKMSTQQFNSALHQVFVNCLLKADESQAQSLAIPLIGTGAVGAPKEDCAELLIRALVRFSSTPNRILNEVYLVNIDREATEALAQCCQDII